MLKIIEFTTEQSRTEDFIALPKKLYDKKTITQNEKEEREILSGAHILSSRFTVHSFLLYDGSDVSGRFIITFYDGDPAAYLGYFECVDSREGAKLIFDYVKEFCRRNGKSSVIGPYDASFWIKYRLKINSFQKPYTGEPYNKDYYYRMFLDNGFTVLRHYVSNRYPRFPLNGSFRDKFIERYKSCIDKGYVFKSPSGKSIDTMMHQSYEILISLFSDFPGYKYINENEFNSLFSHLKYIADKRMMKMVYYDGEPVGFLINFPDYSNRLLKAKLTVADYACVLAKRLRSSHYIWMYMGVKSEHRGLGKALYNSVMNEQCRKRASFTAALIKDGNINAGYMPEVIQGVSEYVLLECKV